MMRGTIACTAVHGATAASFHRTSVRGVLCCAALACARRDLSMFVYSNMYRWRLPHGAKDTNVSKEELDKTRYFDHLPRDKWDYQRVDDNINAQSEFRKTEGREAFFQGMRIDNSTTNAGSLHTPSKYRLYEHFDEYTKPGVNTKLAAAMAVKEQWDAEEFYYPGEAWRRNRPSFRSVPKELLNRQTWYLWSDFITKLDEIQPTMRTRSWNPDWPPPGYRMPKMSTKREFKFGGDDKGLVSEIDRFNWFHAWDDANSRIGWKEVPLLICFVGVSYLLIRNAFSVGVQHSKINNMYYPGRTMVRPFGVPKDWEKECMWWQRPLNEFPNQGEVWFLQRSRFGYGDYIKKRDAREAALAAAEAAAA